MAQRLQPAPRHRAGPASAAPLHGAPSSADTPFIRHWGYWPPTKQERELPPQRNEGLEIVYTAKGELVWRYQGRAVSAGPRSIFFAFPWQVHGSASPTLPTHEIWWVLVALDRDCAYSEPDALRRHPSLALEPELGTWVVDTLRHARQPLAHTDATLGTLLSPIVRELDGRGPGRLARLRAMVQQLLIDLARDVAHTHQPALAASPLPTAGETPAPA